MCDRGQLLGVPSLAGGAPTCAGEAIAMAMAGLGWLAEADLTAVPATVRAESLRGLERVRSVHTAAQASVLSAFDHDCGYEDDGQGTARTWLRWQTRITSQAASGAVGWMRRLRAHPEVAADLRDAKVSTSLAREVCRMTDKLPESARRDADAILLGAAAGGAELTDLARLAEEMRRRLAEPDEDKDSGFDDRRLRLSATLGGAGRLDGDLSAQCTAALQAVLDALGKKAGPEDDRTLVQRHHDALAEACRRLVASGCVPDRAGQPTQIQVHITLDQLIRRLQGAADSTATAPGGTFGPGTFGPGTFGPGTFGPGGVFGAGSVLGRVPVAGPPPGWPAAAPGEECDASIVPIVTGHLDQDLLDRLAAALTAPGRTSDPGGDGGGDGSDGGGDGGDGGAVPRITAAAIRDLITANAVALLSGPQGLASWLRGQTLDGPAASPSLPLDTGTSTETIPPHLRRAVIVRDRHCAAPGCDQPPAGCQVHHLIPRSRGGATKLTNLLLLCTFHHLILVHQWGWTISLNPDGTTTMTSPDGTRSYHSHSPPNAA
jgi:Domain of unknown function (DUF222)/HNH endonuclease